MSEQDRKERVRTNTKDVKGRCEEERHTRQGDKHNPQRAETKTKCVEEFNESPVSFNCTAGA